MEYIDISLLLNPNKSNIVTYEIQNISYDNELLSNKIKMINDYLLTQLLTPLKPFIFPQYNIQYKLIYQLFFLHMLDKSKQEEIVNQIKQYLTYIVQIELSNEIELVDVINEENYISIIYRLIENGKLYEIRLSLKSTSQ